MRCPPEELPVLLLHLCVFYFFSIVAEAGPRVVHLVLDKLFRRMTSSCSSCSLCMFWNNSTRLGETSISHPNHLTIWHIYQSIDKPQYEAILKRPYQRQIFTNKDMCCAYLQIRLSGTVDARKHYMADVNYRDAWHLKTKQGELSPLCNQLVRSAGPQTPRNLVMMMQ